MSYLGGTKTPATKTLLAIIKLIGKSAISFIELSNFIASHQSLITQIGFDLKTIKKLKDETYCNKVTHNLKRRGYIKTKGCGKKLFICLNNKNLTTALANKLKQGPKGDNNLHTLIIFDIPENHKKIRDNFRYLLKCGGFKKLQQSVWISQLDNYHLVKNFIKEQKADTWIKVLRTKDLQLDC